MRTPAPLLLLLLASPLAAASGGSFDVSADGTPVPASGEAPDGDGPGGPDSLIAQQFTSDPLGHRDPLEMVGDGTVGLVGISLLPTSLAGPGGSHAMVEGQFCSYDPAAGGGGLPAGIAEGRSEHCAEHRYAMPLRDALRAARDADASDPGAVRVRVHELSGIVLEEGLQTPGGDLVTSALARLGGSHVVNAHPALRDALSACDVARARFGVEECDRAAHVELVRDVVHLLSRVRPGEGAEADAEADAEEATPDRRTMYVKLSMESTVYLPLLAESFPSAPWTLVYDDDAAHALGAVTATGRGPCARSARRPSEALVRKGEEIGGAEALRSLSVHEVCAAYLSAGLDVAVREFEDGDRGMLISRSEDMDGGDGDGKAEAFLDRMKGHFGLEHHGAPALLKVWDLVSLSPVIVSNGGRGERDDLAEVERASELFMGESMDRLRRARRRKMV